MSNPLIAPTQDSTKWFTGVSLLETANGLKTAIESGDWASVAMGAVGTALDALSMALDPFGAILAAGVSWLMEHVGPLKDALDALAGNADEVQAQAQTWANVAKELGEVSEELTGLVKKDLESWKGEAADAYRKQAADTATVIQSAQKGSEGASSGVKTAGEVVAAVRTLVRDIIAELIGHLISWALQVVFTLGIGLTWVVPQVVAAVAKTAAKITDLTTKLVKALKALVPLLKKAGDLFDDAAKALKNLKGGKVTPSGKPKDLDTTPKGPPKDKDKGGDESTTSSGDHSSPKNDPPKTDPPPKNDPPKNDPPDNSRGLDGSQGGGSTTTSGAKGGDGKRNPSETKEPGCKEGSGDPIDVQSGDVLVTESDLVVPGPLGQLVVRNHVSSYRGGRWFGPSWASLVDERLTVANGTVTYHTADAMILRFPVPAPGTEATALHGPPRRLRGEGAEYFLTDPGRGTERRFAPADGDPDLFLLKEIRTEDHAYVELEHDDHGAPATLRHSGGAWIAFDVSDGRIRAIRALAEATEVPVARYDYDTRGHLSVRANSSPHPARYSHDAEGRITGWTDHSGAWYRYVYDAYGRCVRGVGDQGYLDTSLVFGERTTTVTDSFGFRTVYEFDEDGNTAGVTDRLGGVTRSEYGPRDVLLNRTDQLGRRTEFEHDAAGRLRSVIRADGSRVVLTEWTTTELAIEVTDDDRVFRRRYTAPNVPDPYTDPLGVTEDQHLEDTYGDDPSQGGVVPRLEVDLFGRPRAVEDAGGRTVYAWTVEGSLREVVAANGTRRQWAFDGESRETARTDELGRTFRTENGPMGTITATIDPAGARTTWRYDTELRLVAVTNPAGQTWQFTYDAEGRLLTQQDFAGRITRCDYDAAGQRVRRVSAAGETVEWRYDLLGNPIERISPSGTETYRYDPVGRLVRATGPDGVLELDHDDAGRVVRQTGPAGDTAVGYSGGTKTMRTPSGVDVLWGQTGDGAELLRIAGTELTLREDSAGRTVALSAGANPLLRQEFDAAGRLVAQHTPAGTKRYHRRPDGSVAAREDPSGGVRYEYDHAGRVTAALHHGAAERYAYDVLGNLLTSSPGPGPETGPRQYTEGGVLAAAGAARYVHDGQGRLIRRTLPAPDGTELTWLFGWDAHDHLVTVRTPDGTHWRYRYDALDRRVAKERLDVAGAVAERVDFTWDGNDLVEARHTFGGVPVETLTWIRHPYGDRVLAQARTLPDGRTEVAAVITDEIGTPTELVGPVDGRVSPVRTSVWGLVVPGTRPETPLRFPGQFHDAETGLYFNVFRYYDPVNARYISPDPLGLSPGPNPETYVDDPFLEADPLGLTRNSGKQTNYADDPYAYLDDDDTFNAPAPCKKAKRPAVNQNPGAGNAGNGAGFAKKAKTGRYEPPITGDANKSHGDSGRTVMEGGGKEGKGTLDGSGKGQYPGGTEPAGNHLTDVDGLNGKGHSNYDPRLRAELDKLRSPDPNDKVGYKPDHPNGYFIKGHLQNQVLGGSGTADNMTTLSRKANAQMSGNFEGKLKEADIKIGQVKEAVGGLSDTALQGKLDQLGINKTSAQFRDEIKKLEVDYSVTASDKVKWKDAVNPEERGIRDHLVLNAEYKNLTPDVQSFLDFRMKPGFLTQFPPVGTKMDTISGKFDPPL